MGRALGEGAQNRPEIPRIIRGVVYRCIQRWVNFLSVWVVRYFGRRVNVREE